ncbi:MAG TPA: EamA/RhaT family transporter, partial [Gammaproteobacteria bacterium]|nr:EamA/RhaT family transporter [Gammaproteobacteria bacterium]
MPNNQQALSFGLGAVLLWSTVATAFKLALRQLQPLQLLFIAAGTACLLLLIIIIIKGRWQQLLAIHPKERNKTLLLGILNPGLYYVVLFKAYDLLPAQEAQALNYTWAITLALLSVPILKQQLRKTDLAALSLSYAGVLVIATHGKPWLLEFSNTTGVALALGSTLLWSFFWLINVKNRLDPILSLFLNFLGALPFITAAMLLFSDFPSLNEAWWPAIYVGCFEMGFTFILWLKALKATDSA